MIGKLYITVVRPAMIYRSEWWAVNKNKGLKMKDVGMRTLR